MNFLWDGCERDSRIRAVPIPGSTEHIKELERILLNKDVQVRLFPVASLGSGVVAGWDAFVKGPERSSLQSRDELFKWANESKRAVEADLLCVETTLCEAECQPRQGGLLFLDVMVGTLENDQLAALLKKSLDWLKPWNIVLSLRSIPSDFLGLGPNSRTLIQSGVRICVEYSSLAGGAESSLTGIRPHFIKMPVAIICRPQQSGANTVMEAFLAMVSSIGGAIVATGIEEKRQVEACRALGIQFIEGPMVADLGL